MPRAPRLKSAIESASQFKRECKRFFGQTPMRDIKVRRLTGYAMVSD
jgi:AraC-like DNA-binding protein